MTSLFEKEGLVATVEIEGALEAVWGLTRVCTDTII
jgi:hypothetical protein